MHAYIQAALATATRAKPPMKTVRILQNVSGAFRPGTITLLVGPPGGGKSLLMKALCGAAPVATTGSITYNGHELKEFNVVRTAQYVAQQNLHNPALTVKETLMFSAMCQGPGYNPGVLLNVAPLQCCSSSTYCTILIPWRCICWGCRYRDNDYRVPNSSTVCCLIHLLCSRSFV